jgi:CheY-like chemotaxis protein
MSTVCKEITILAVEDDLMDIELLKHGLKKAGVTNPLRHAESGVEALEILRGKNGREKISAPFIMLIDINMPRMNGLEMLQELRSDKALTQNIAFILTTSDREQDRKIAYNLNAAGYFLKGNLDHLIKILASYSQGNRFPCDSF